MPYRRLSLLGGRGCCASRLLVLAAAVLACVVVGAGQWDRWASPSPPSAQPKASPGSGPLFIPATAHVSGAAGTDWRSDVEIYNVGPGQAFIDVAVLAKNQANPTPATRSFVISPGMAFRYRDVLERFFGVSGSAALRLDAGDDRLVVTSRTFNQTAAGTYGQFIGAVEEASAIRFGQPGRIVQLAQHRTTDTGFRTNVGLLSCTDAESSVRIELFGGDGSPLGSRELDLEPHMYTQIDRIFSSVTSDPVEDGFAVVSALNEDGELLAYGSVVDNRTGDPIYIPAAVPCSEPVVIPAAAHVSGAAGTDWRTDLELHNPGAFAEQYEIALLATDRDNSSPMTSVRQVAAGASLRLDDVLQSVFGFDGTAALRITPMAGAEAVITSRTFNQTASGTYGQFLGAVPASAGLEHGEQGLMVGLSHNRGSTAGSRTNLGFVNCSSTEAAVRIDLYRASGELLGSVEETLGPLMHRQLNRIFGRVTADDVEDGFAILTVSTPGSSVIAYASVVDNATGDPVYVPAAEIAPQPFETTMDPRATVFLLFQGLDQAAIESLVELVQTDGLEAAFGEVALAFPGMVSVGPSSIVLDFGDGYRLEDGNLLSGRLAVSVADASITASQVFGRPSFVFEDFRWNGQAPPVDTIFSTWDLAVDADGHVTGTTTFSGTGTLPAKSTPVTFEGDALWNTLLCRHFPVGGTFTLEIGDQRYTFSFTPDCDGDFDYSEGTPGWDWTYAYGNPNDAHAQQYLAGVANAEVWYQPPVFFWKPEVGGETLGDAPPGVITFRFSFDRPVSEAHLKLNMPTFHWWYSRGHNLLYGSRDGSTWELLMEVPSPEYGMANAGEYDSDLPASLTGTEELWLRAELYSYGEMAPQGGQYANTAQLTRWDESNPGRTFQLDVRFEND